MLHPAELLYPLMRLLSECAKGGHFSTQAAKLYCVTLSVNKGAFATPPVPVLEKALSSAT